LSKQDERLTPETKPIQEKETSLSKRFTDSKKWKNSWFRNLTSEQKLTWIYLCDECEFYGVIKIDYELACFQLNFKIDAQKIKEWFKNKCFFIDHDKILIVPFFEFQYGSSKDSWSAKQKAIEKLNSFGFSFINSKLQVDFSLEFNFSYHSGGDSLNTVLIKDTDKGKGKEEGIVFENQREEIAQESSVNKFNAMFDKKIDGFNHVLDKYGWRKRCRLFIGSIVNSFEEPDDLERFIDLKNINFNI